MKTRRARTFRAGSILGAVFLMALASPPNGAQRSAGARPTPGVTEALAVDRAPRVSDLRYDLSLTIPADRSERSPAAPSITFSLGDAAAPLALDFEPNGTGAVRPWRSTARLVDARAATATSSCRHPSCGTGANRVTIEFDAGDAPLNRNDDFLYTIFVPGARARGVSLLRSAGSEGALDAGARRARRLGDARQRRGDRARRARRPDALTFAETQPIPDLPVRVCRRQVRRRARRARRPHVPHAAPRDRRAEGRAQPRRDLRPARGRARVARALHRHSVPVRQVRFLSRAGVSVRRHGAPGRDLLQRRRPDARRVGDAEPAARTRQHDRARDRAHVVRRSGDDEVVHGRVDEGGVRELHGGEDREPVVSGASTTSCGSCTPTTRPPTTSTARPAPTRSGSRSRT